MPMDRPGEDARRALDALFAQKTSRTFEVIVVGGSGQPPLDGVVMVAMEDRNPATRRNRAVAVATGEILAFIDDDAFAEPGWIETACEYLDTHRDVVLLGGPDTAPDDSSPSELLSETLLSARWIGSGVLCHEAPEGIRPINAPHDLALVNLFVRRTAFAAMGGLDERIGYIGEDTALVEKAMSEGSVVYHSGVVVRHRRRSFPGPYLRQRWRYRVKTGQMLLARHSAYRSEPRVTLFLFACTAGLLLLALVPTVGAAVLACYLAAVSVIALPARRLPMAMWPLVPPAFLLHHATYYLGIMTGALRVIVSWLLRRA